MQPWTAHWPSIFDEGFKPISPTAFPTPIARERLDSPEIQEASSWPMPPLPSVSPPTLCDQHRAGSEAAEARARRMLALCPEVLALDALKPGPLEEMMHATTNAYHTAVLGVMSAVELMGPSQYGERVLADLQLWADGCPAPRDAPCTWCPVSRP